MFLGGWGKRPVSLIPPDFPFHSTPEKETQRTNKSDVNWIWEHATHLRRDFATPPLFFFLCAANANGCEPPFFKDQIRTERWGRRRATRWRLWGSHVNSPQLKIPVSDMWSQEFDIRGSSQMIPAFLLIVYRLCPLLLEPSINLFFYIYINIYV